ncbi:hypothetical protein HWD99_10625 [Microbacterium sp. C5A9]|uniref:Clp protease N-terminal domain-containing protein n=1 Tax=Microbacterium sp. C5A9 TaxID=2736663 RepID=UPI001F521428|nr:Clp protease N-terminal domain-containing protein [Microbacterium sp. C5A9]MCI1019081.1 hypothetical protein [Microbacterium sp. C5A9]
MSRIVRTMKWFREMSVLAEDEQRRLRHPEIDVEHLFLALLSIGGPVTDALARDGVTLAAARTAFQTLHANRLARLGVSPEGRDADRRIPEGTTRGGFVYRDGVRVMLENAAADPHPDRALFAALVDEPSGHVREVLRELGIGTHTGTGTDAYTGIDIGTGIDTGTDALASGISDAVVREDTGAREARPGAPREYRRFVPFPMDEVRSLVSSPERWLDWNDFEAQAATVSASGTVHAQTRERRIDGRPARVRPAYATTDHRIRSQVRSSRIEWERSFPLAPQSVNQILRIELLPRGTGTDLVLSLRRAASDASTDGARHRSIRALLLAPIRRVVVRAHLRGKADNVSRALRS